MDDLEFMRQALALAEKGRGQVSPNPLVGAVIVNGDKIVGRGYHLFDLKKHAEICALAEAGDQAMGATIYLNLEPCCHHGRTPPCTDALLRSGIRRVVAAMSDPNPLVAGQGFAILRAAGIDVEVGLCQEQARRLNEKFITYIVAKRPFVHLKVAMTLDGKIATYSRQAKWITGPTSRHASQLLRAEYDAILVGIGTIITDDPELTVRIEHQRRRPLMRVVLDSRLRMPLNARLWQSSTINSVLIFAERDAALSEHGGAEQLQARIDEFQQRGAEIIFLPGENNRVDLKSALAELGQRQITSLIVEGGAEVNGEFLSARLIDKVSFFIAPKLVGGRAAVPAIGGAGFDSLTQALELMEITLTWHDQDIEITAYPKIN
jgi:diaminohydroxyphosphoribosylaminopyrimidine deaminase/5-amino-6-(5-phosphoribosylamino)uracil reductase